MTTDEKISLLPYLMEVKKRDDGTEFYCFSDKAPKDLQNKFLGSYEVRNLDYKIFAYACDVLDEVYNDIEKDEDIDEKIYEYCTEQSSVYNSDRLELLNIWNDGDIGEIFKEYNCDNISEACAIWFDKEVENACFFINEWINNEND